jgi:P-type Cu+ transporter
MLRSARATTYRQVSIRLGGLPAVQDLASAQGLGVSGMVDGHAVAAGRAGWLENEWAWDILSGLAARAEASGAAGGTAVFAGWDGQARGVLVIADTIKPASAEAIRRLRGGSSPPQSLRLRAPRRTRW